MTTKTAEEWFQEGLAELDLSRGADSMREYHGDLHDAAWAFLQCLKLNTGHLQALKLRGLTLEKLSDHDDALDCLVAAAAQTPDDPEIIAASARCTFELGRFADAVPLFVRAVELTPGDPHLIRGLGKAQLFATHYEAAIPRFEALLRDPKLVQFFGRDDAANLAIALTRAAKPGAGDALREAITRWGKELPRVPEYFLEFLDEHRPALRSVEDGVHDPALLRAIAATWVRIGAPEAAERARGRARKARDAAVEKEPSSAERWLAKAEDHLFDQEHELAFAAFEQSAALSIDPAKSVARARLDYERGRYERAGPWKLMGRDEFAREDFVVGTFATHAEAQAALEEREKRASSTDESVRDSFWLVRP